MDTTYGCNMAVKPFEGKPQCLWKPQRSIEFINFYQNCIPQDIRTWMKKERKVHLFLDNLHLWGSTPVVSNFISASAWDYRISSNWHDALDIHVTLNYEIQYFSSKKSWWLIQYHHDNHEHLTIRVEEGRGGGADIEMSAAGSYTWTEDQIIFHNLMEYK